MIYTRRIAVQAVVVWLAIRLALIALAIQAEWPEPTKLALKPALLLIGLVPAVTWLDLRRRNLLILLPNLGISVPLVLALTAAIAAVAELIAGALIL